MQRRFLILGICLVVGFAVGILAFASSGPGGPPVPLILVVVIAGAVGSLVFVIAMARRRRAGQKPDGTPESIAAERGWTHDAAPDEVARETLEGCPFVSRGATVRHLMQAPTDHGLLRIFEHRVLVYTGQAFIPVYHTIAAIDVPADWPRVRLHRRSWLSRGFCRIFGERGLRLEHPGFNRAYRVDAADEDFALLVLTPEQQERLATHPRDKWEMGRGWLAVAASGSMNVERAAGVADRLLAFRAEVPSELDAWMSAA